jgi:POT family proton-dependent oligopeptide transporter
MSTSAVATQATKRPFATFFGEPFALAFLAGTEAWERFSYYGMVSILTLYMTEWVLRPGHAGHVAGLDGFRRLLEVPFGPLSTTALASAIFGLYTGVVYFTPILGGVIADRWLGRHRAVLLGAALLAIGQSLMALDATFLIALLLLVLGCGFLKGNISIQVNTLYAPADQGGQSRGFTLFVMGINVGAFAGPLVCGLLAQLWGWHAAFAVAGAFMVLGLVTYLAGYRTLAGLEAARTPEARSIARGGDLRLTAALLLLMGLAVPYSVTIYQEFNMYQVWIAHDVATSVGGFRTPPSWLVSVDSAVTVGGGALLVMLSRSGQVGWTRADIFSRLLAASLIMTLAHVMLALAARFLHPVPIVVPVVFDLLAGVAFVWSWPPFLAIIAEAAPRQAKAVFMGLAMSTLFLSGLLVGWIGAGYDRMTPAAFWALNAAIALGGALLVLAESRPSRA